MEMLTKEEFAELAGHKSDCSVSIYLPVHESGVEVNEKQDLIVFKNLLAEASAQLITRGFSAQKAAQFLEPATALVREGEFWLGLSKGLGLLISQGFFRILHLPFSVEAGVYTNSSFHLSPAIQLFCDCPYFYLLVLSKKSTSFYRGNRYGLDLLDIEGLPQGVNDVIHFEEKSERKLFRMAGTAPGGQASYHGHGSGLSDEKEYISQYLKEVEQTLEKEILANEQSPLLLAGVEYIVGIFRQVSRYKYIVEEALTGNYEHVDVSTLFHKAHELVRPYLQQNSKKALQNYYNQLATPLTSSMPDKVIPASYYKQVAELFVQQDFHIWGSFDEADNALKINEKRQPGDECLVNKAIISTLKNGGDVYVLEPERMPNGATMAATLRF
jgi:rRNA processing protein Krr1/Pno1